MYIVGKFGGGVLSSVDSLLRLHGVSQSAGCNFLVISAFSGQTRILESVCVNQSLDHFYSHFLPFHEYLARETYVYDDPSVHRLFNEKVAEMEVLMDRLRIFSQNDARLTEGVVAEIMATGEDYSTTIVHALLSRMASTGQKFRFVDSREMIQTDPEFFIRANFDQKKTERAIRKKLGNSRRGVVYITQGFVCGTVLDGFIKTTVMPFDGSDVTAALLSAALPKRKDERHHKLIFFKRHTGEGQQLPIPKGGALGVHKLFEFMKKNQTVVVSPDIENVKGLPPFFEIRDYDTPNRVTLVSTQNLKLGPMLRSIKLN